MRRQAFGAGGLGLGRGVMLLLKADGALRCRGRSRCDADGRGRWVAVGCGARSVRLATPHRRAGEVLIQPSFGIRSILGRCGCAASHEISGPSERIPRRARLLIPEYTQVKQAEPHHARDRRGQSEGRATDWAHPLQQFNLGWARLHPDAAQCTAEMSPGLHTATRVRSSAAPASNRAEPAPS